MIEQCNKQDMVTVLSYIGKDYPKCLYLYIDMQKYGCLSPVTQMWKLSNDDNIHAVLLAYHSALHIYSKDIEFDVSELLEFILRRNPSIICARTEIIKILEPYLNEKGFTAEYGHVGRFVNYMPVKSIYKVMTAKSENIKEIANLLYQDEDIGASYTLEDLVKQIEERLSDNYVRSYVIKSNDGHVIAHLGTGAEIENICTISYVITEQKYRGKGLSSALFSYACKELETEGKEIYSVYYPENSRKLHHKMGFEDCCEIGKLFRNIQ